jgi:hypothetical protein
MFNKIVILVCALCLFALGHAFGVSSATDARVAELTIEQRVERISFIPTHLRTDAELAICRTYQEQLLK